MRPAGHQAVNRKSTLGCLRFLILVRSHTDWQRMPLPERSTWLVYRPQRASTQDTQATNDQPQNPKRWPQPALLAPIPFQPGGRLTELALADAEAELVCARAGADCAERGP